MTLLQVPILLNPSALGVSKVILQANDFFEKLLQLWLGVMVTVGILPVSPVLARGTRGLDRSGEPAVVQMAPVPSQYHKWSRLYSLFYNNST